MISTLFSSERLDFRKMDKADIDLVESLFNELAAMTFYPPEKIRENARLWIEAMRGSYKKWGMGSWLLELQDDGRFIGQCGLNKTDLCKSGMFELGFSFLKEFWNKGYATEAARACIAFAQKTKKINTLIAVVEVDNIASQHVLAKLPLTYKKTMKQRGQTVHVFQKTFNRE